MVKTTKAQRAALKRKWMQLALVTGRSPVAQLLTYKQFRATVQPYYDGSGCVMVPWCGMWVGIETDGYTHT